MSADRPMLGRRTCLDANLYIYTFEGIETYRTKIAGLLAAINRQGVRVVASELLFTELLPCPMKEGRQDLIERYLELFRNTRRFHLAPVDRRVILRSFHCGRISVCAQWTPCIWRPRSSTTARPSSPTTSASPGWTGSAYSPLLV